MTTTKPRIGLLGITQELYDDVVAGITDYQQKHGTRLKEFFSDAVDLVFPGPARNRDDIERFVESFNEQKLDGIMLVMFTYAPSLMAIRALQDNRLPLLLANIQPERTVTSAWNMDSLTYNQGIHGIQDMSNCIYKLGLRPVILSGDWQSSEFTTRLIDWARAAQTVARLRQVKVASFGQMPGMGDITGDPNDILRVLGVQVDFQNAGEIYEAMENADPKRVDAAMAADHENFDVDPNLSEDRHRYASTMYVGIKEYLVRNDYAGFCVHFDALGRDGRFDQIHMLAASNLMAEGYGYAAEGDVLTSSLMIAGHTIAPDAHFTEMYAMDFDRNAVLMSHMGEGNWKVGRRDAKPRLINRELRIGGLSNPPTVLFSAEPGPVTLVSLANLSGGRFRLVAAEGTALEDGSLPEIEMPYFFIRFGDHRVEDLATRWLENAGTHHQVMHLGHVKERWRNFAKLLGIEFVDLA
jgi:L-arabinose isomerase